MHMNIIYMYIICIYMYMYMYMYLALIMHRLLAKGPSWAKLGTATCLIEVYTVCV